MSVGGSVEDCDPEAVGYCEPVVAGGCDPVATGDCDPAVAGGCDPVVTGDCDPVVAGSCDSVAVWGCDPVGGTLASGVPELCSVGVGVKGTPLLVGEGSVFASFQCEVGLVASWSRGSTESFLGNGDSWAEAVTRGVGLLSVPLVAEAGWPCRELVQLVVSGVIVVGRETGKRVDVGTLCTLSPVKSQDKIGYYAET